MVTWKGDSGGDWQRAVTVLPDGRVRALYVGGTAARAATSTVIATFPVTVEPAPLFVRVAESLSAKWELIQGMISYPPVPVVPTGPPEPLPDMTAQWDGGGCIVKREISLPEGRVGQFAKVCTARYGVTADSLPRATRYEANFFEINHTNRLFSVAGSTPLLRTELSGPDASLSLMPGPTLLDRVNVTAWDIAGHLLGSGSACVHGCAGWPSIP